MRVIFTSGARGVDVDNEVEKKEIQSFGYSYCESPATGDGRGGGERYRGGVSNNEIEVATKEEDDDDDLVVVVE